MKENKSKKYSKATLYLLFCFLILIGIGIVSTYYLTHDLDTGGPTSGTSCLSSPGYGCMYPAPNDSGLFSVEIFQSTGATEYNIGIACAAATLGDGEPNPATAFIYPNQNNNGIATNIYNPANTYTLATGQSVIVRNITCYNSHGVAISNETEQVFSGTLFINYTTANGTVGPSNPWQTVKLATITIKVT